MKFELFGRLRDNNGDNTSQDSMGGGGFDSNAGGAAPGGGSLQRTVENMFDQGYSETEIKEELGDQYSEQEIERSINNAVTSNATGGGGQEGPEPMTPYQEDSDEAVSPMDEGFDQESEDQGFDAPEFGSGQQNQIDSGGNDQGGFSQQQQTAQQSPSGQQMQNSQTPQGSGTVDPEVEELIETIVAENFQRMESEFENVYEELDIIEEAVEDLEQRVHDLEIRDDEDQQQFVQKVDEIEDHIDSYESRIGGLEKAFQQVLPSLVDNVRDLTRLVQEIKQERGIETETNVSEQDIDDMKDW